MRYFERCSHIVQVYLCAFIIRNSTTGNVRTRCGGRAHASNGAILYKFKMIYTHFQHKTMKKASSTGTTQRRSASISCSTSVYTKQKLYIFRSTSCFGLLQNVNEPVRVRAHPYVFTYAFLPFLEILLFVFILS